jgi:GH15 family glucan-1,4-alpha-glucosidase
MPRSPESASSIGDYAMIGDCRTASLISRQGSVDWLCLPDFSSPSVFAAVLDPRRGGRFAVHPLGSATLSRRYLDKTNVLETTFVTEGGILRLQDLMPLPIEGGLTPQRELLRILEVVEGAVEVEIIYEPRPDYARARPHLYPCGAVGWACAYRDSLMMLHADVPLEPSAMDRSSLAGRITLSQGSKAYLSLTYVSRDIGVFPPLGAAAEKRARTTLDWWESRSACCTYRGPYREPVLRSALTLKALTYALSGAVVAAPTTSIPELTGGALNWDYRFCWLRDASLTIEAFLGVGYRTEAEAFLEWLLHATQLTRPRLQVLYDIFGETRIPEKVLDHLEGYRGSRPVRIGNDASRQFQLDVYGEVVRAAMLYADSGGSLDRYKRQVLAGFGRAVCRDWRQPDHGIWEIRETKRHYTYSKVMCWATLDRLLKLAERGHVCIPRTTFMEERAAIRTAIDTHGFNSELQSYVGTFNSRDADASLLLMAHYGYLAPTDARMRGTFDLIDRQLGQGALLRRYSTGYNPIDPSESAFGICSFWAVDYLARAGRIEEATQRFEALLRLANDVGLYGEQIEFASGAPSGNFPQAFTHVGLIIAALALAEAEPGRGMRTRGGAPV